MDLEGEIAGNALVQLFMERVRPRLLEITQRMAENRHRLAEFQAENRKQLTTSDRYALDCMSTLNSLRRGLARVEHARALLNASSSGLKAKAARLSRDDWTDYHFAFWTVALASLMDLCLIASAQILERGFPPRLCTLDNVTSHSSTGRGQVKSLRKLNTTLESHKQRRHRYLHRGESADFGELTDAEFLRDLRAVTWVNALDSSIADKRFLTQAWAKALRDLRPHLDTATADVGKCVGGVLDSLLEPARRKLEFYDALTRLQVP